MHSELVRQRIRTTALINRLTACALGKLKKDMEPHHVTAAIAVLKKTLPDLESIEHIGEVSHTVHTVTSEPLSEEDWMATYGNKGQPLNG